MVAKWLLFETAAPYLLSRQEGRIVMCEDYPCCSHELGDCEGRLYGSDESIKAQVQWEMDNEPWPGYYDELRGPS